MKAREIFVTALLVNQIRVLECKKALLEEQESFIVQQLRTLDIMLSDLNMLYGLPGDGKSLQGEVGLCVEPDAENDDGEVAWKLPVHPLTELPCQRRRPLEEVALGPLIEPRGQPPDPCPRRAYCRCAPRRMAALAAFMLLRRRRRVHRCSEEGGYVG
uniref:Uncharacterized protein n=1 Tax=Oryza nivara TaxID=4536 RepID=A0A0E0FMA3_ORYNI